MKRHLDEDALTNHLLGESTVSASAAVERHLAACAACRRQEAELRYLIGVFAGMAGPRPRAEILDSLLSAQERLNGSRRQRLLQGGLWTTATLAAVAAVFAVGFWTGRRTSPELWRPHPIPVLRSDAGHLREPDLAMPPVMFVAAIPDRVAGLARQDTTTN